MADGTNLYKGKTKTPRKVNRAAERKEKEVSVALFKRRSLILIGSLPLFQPGVPVLEFMSSARDYGESETGIISRNKVNNHLCRNFDCRFMSSAEDYRESETGIIPWNKANNYFDCRFEGISEMYIGSI